MKLMVKSRHLYGTADFSFTFGTVFSKNNPKNKQMSIAKKKFNMDPKKVSDTN